MGTGNIGGKLIREGSDEIHIVYADNILMALCPDSATVGNLFNTLVSLYGPKQGDERYVYGNENGTCTLVEKFPPSYEFPEKVIGDKLASSGYKLQILGRNPEVDAENPLPHGREQSDIMRDIILENKRDKE